MERVPDWSWWKEAHAIAARRARGASDAADDLAQDLALAALERGSDVARPGAWLERVGRNAVVDGWRGERRRRALALELDGPTPTPDPEADVLARERRAGVRRALASLPRALRRATLARFHAELSFDAVAARLGTEPVTARTRVHRALARLRARVSGLRALAVWMPGAQATALGLALVAAVARPAPVLTAAASVAFGPSTHARRIAAAPALTAPASPSAARPAPARVVERAPRVEAPTPKGDAVQRFSYDDDEIPGELARPDAIVIVSDAAVRHHSLIELRAHFIPELVKTLEDL